MISTGTGQAIEIEPPSGFRRLFSVFAPVKRSEVLTVVVLSVNVFVLLSCYYVLKVVREPLILVGGGAEIKAYASAGQAVLLVAAVPGFSWLSTHVSRVRLLTTMQLIFAGCLVAFYVLAHLQAPIGVAFYLWLGIFNMFVVANFWSFANDLYTEEQGKRLFGVIGIGASVGAIVGAFVPQFLHRAIGMHALMLLAAAGLGVSIVLYRLADRREGQRADRRRASEDRASEDRARIRGSEKPASTALGREGGFALVAKDRYLRLLAAMVLVATVINTTGEYVMSKLASDRSKAHAAQVVAAHERAADAATADRAAGASSAGGTSASDPAKTDGKSAGDPATTAADDSAKASKAAQDDYIAKFFSNYYTLVNLLSLLLQALLVARLLTKLGIRRALFIMPVVVLGGWFALVLFVNVTIVRIEKTVENSLDYSLHNTLRHALFLPTSRESKYKAKAAVDTFVVRMGDVIAGLGIVFLLVEVFGLGVRAFAVMNVALAAGWLVLAVFAGRHYDKLAAARADAGEGTDGGRR